MSKQVAFGLMSDPRPASRDVNLPDLEVFVTAATSRSFRTAAARLYTSQPAVSRSVGRLEGALGVRLFARSRRGSRLTASGDALLVHARRVVNLIADIRSAPLQAATSTIRLGTAGTAAGSFLAKFLAEWIQSHQHVSLRVVEDGAARLTRRLWEGEVDLAIVASPLPPSFDSYPITRVGISAHFPEGHPLDRGTAGLTASDLAPYPLLINQPAFISAQLISAEFEQTGVQANIVYRSSVGQTLGSLAEAGMGIALFSESVDMRSARLRRRPMVDTEGKQLEFHLRIAWRRGDDTPELKEFARELSTFVTLNWRPYGDSLP